MDCVKEITRQIIILRYCQTSDKMSDLYKYVIYIYYMHKVHTSLFVMLCTK